MKRGTFRAISAAAFLGLVCLVGFLATRPALRQAIGSFIAPLPPLPGPSSREAPSALPLEVTWTGGESRELQRLRSTVDAGAGARIPREALFPSRTQAEGKAAPRMEALHRPEMIRREDSRIDAAVSYLAHDSRGHGALLAAWKRSGRYRPTMDRVLRAWSVPEDLVAIATVESAFVATAVQPDGSAGLWSLPKDVAQACGLTIPRRLERAVWKLAASGSRLRMRLPARRNRDCGPAFARLRRHGGPAPRQRRELRLSGLRRRDRIRKSGTLWARRDPCRPAHRHERHGGPRASTALAHRPSRRDEPRAPARAQSR